jgi:putative membrane protein
MMGDWGMTLGSWIWMLVWVAALLLMVWLIVAGGRTEQREDPLELLRSRYARGEITEDEFRRMRTILTKPGGIR